MLIPTAISWKPVVWTTSKSMSAATNSAGYGSNDAFRIIIDAAQLAATGRYVRFTFKPASSGSNTPITAAYFAAKAAAGNAWDYDGNQKQILVGGSGTFTLTAGGAEVVSDPILHVVDTSKNLVVGWQMNAGDTIYSNSNTGVNAYFKTAGGDAATTAPTGYGSPVGTNRTFALTRVEAGS